MSSMKNTGRMILTAALVAGLYAVAAAQQPQMIEIPAWRGRGL